jgi:prepilin-type N-terminal cleavage/methylation domain-containing protein
MIYRKNRGFTILELLIVLAIIGLLTGVLWAYVNSARGKGNDARRLADMQNIQKALEIYQNENRAYPGIAATAYVSGSGTCVSTYAQISTLLGTSFISKIPTDPRIDRCYFYIPDSGNQGYKLFMQPEDTAWLAKDSGCTSTQAPAATYYCKQH